MAARKAAVLSAQIVGYRRARFTFSRLRLFRIEACGLGRGASGGARLSERWKFAVSSGGLARSSVLGDWEPFEEVTEGGF